MTTPTIRLHRAAREGDVESCRALLDAKAKIDSRGDTTDGETALHVAARYGHVDFCRLLIDRGININVVDKYGHTALHVAVNEERVQVCRLLLGRGANPDMRNGSGRTPLHLCPWLAGARPKQKEATMAKLLLAHGADMYALARHVEDMETPLHVAVRNGRLLLCQALVSAGASSSYVPPDALPKYITPFQMAVREGWADLVFYFLSECGEDIAQRTRAGRSMMQLAGSYQPVKEVLRAFRTELAISTAVAVDSNEDVAPRKRSGGPVAL